MKNTIIASLATLLAACGAPPVSDLSEGGKPAIGETSEGLSSDIQRKFFVVEERGLLHSAGADPSTDQLFATLTFWDGNSFILCGSNPGQLSYDPALPDGSGGASTVFCSYLDDPSCRTQFAGTQDRDTQDRDTPDLAYGVERSGDPAVSKNTCHGTENVFFVGVPTPFVLPLDYTYVTNIGTTPGLDTGATLDSIGGSASAVEFRRASRPRCLAAMTKFRAFVAANHLSPHLRLTDEACR